MESAVSNKLATQGYCLLVALFLKLLGHCQQIWIVAAISAILQPLTSLPAVTLALAVVVALGLCNKPRLQASGMRPGTLTPWCLMLE